MAEVTEKKKLPELEDPGIWAVRIRLRAYRPEIIDGLMKNLSHAEAAYVQSFMDKKIPASHKSTEAWLVLQDLKLLIKYRKAHIADVKADKARGTL